ncbi:hypothetical protein KY284_000382 [Solanum tuberosum]|nr:hypothetical protein KY284_000382 [Solanum tuberosum]
MLVRATLSRYFVTRVSSVVIHPEVEIIQVRAHRVIRVDQCRPSFKDQMVLVDPVLVKPVRSESHTTRFTPAITARGTSQSARGSAKGTKGGTKGARGGARSYSQTSGDCRQFYVIPGGGIVDEAYINNGVLIFNLPSVSFKM